MNGPRRRLFVKSLEMVQGDERDAIILSMGRAKGADGRLRMQFGPINHEGGERRLNVAVTRARRRMHVVISFNHEDMAPNWATKGPAALRRYLESAATGTHPREVGRATGLELNALERDVLDALEKRDIPVTPQWGESDYRIDFALADPDLPGRMVLALEMDGDSYHRLTSVRDRDRLRQTHLEGMGWRAVPPGLGQCLVPGPGGASRPDRATLTRSCCRTRREPADTAACARHPGARAATPAPPPSGHPSGSAHRSVHRPRTR